LGKVLRLKQPANGVPAKSQKQKDRIMKTIRQKLFPIGVVLVCIAAAIGSGYLVFRLHNLPPNVHAEQNAEPKDGDLNICVPKWERGVISHVHLGPFPFTLSTHYSPGNLGDQDCLSIRKDSDGNILGNKSVEQLNAFLIAPATKLFITRSSDGYYINIVD
jgi:hypothetical protein